MQTTNNNHETTNEVPTQTATRTLTLSVLQWLAIRSVLGQLLPIKMPMPVADKLFLLVEQMDLQPELLSTDKLRRKLITDKYGVEDERHNWKVPPEKSQAFNEEYTALANKPLTLTFAPIPDALRQIGGWPDISPIEVMSLRPIWESYVMPTEEPIPAPVLVPPPTNLASKRNRRVS